MSTLTPKRALGPCDFVGMDEHLIAEEGHCLWMKSKFSLTMKAHGVKDDENLFSNP